MLFNKANSDVKCLYLENEFMTDAGLFGICASEDCIEKTPLTAEILVRGVCYAYNLNHKNYGDTALTVAANKAIHTLTAAVLDQLEGEILFKIKSESTKSDTEKIASSTSLQYVDLDGFDGSDILQHYNTPNSELAKTPKSTVRKKEVTLSETPKSRFSITLLSPNVRTPSAKYAARQNPLETVSSFGLLDSGWDCNSSAYKTKDLIIITQEPYNQLFATGYQIMLQKLTDVAEALSESIDDLSEKIQDVNKDIIEEFHNVKQTTSENFFVCGMVHCEGVGKLNEQSVFLQGSQSTSIGVSMRLDISCVSEFSLFPGQIIACEVSNPTGHCLIVHRLFPGVLAASYSLLPEQSGALSLVIAAGPFTTSDSLDYQPFMDLLQYVADFKPDYLILCGPFVDRKHPLIELGGLLSKALHLIFEECLIGATYDNLFQRLMGYVIETTTKCRTRAIIVSSVRDVHHSGVFPTIPFHSTLDKDDKRITFVSDPSVVEVNRFTIGVTAVDTLFHLGAEEIFKLRGDDPSDRMSRLINHIFLQQRFYPVYPPAEDLNVDYEQFYQFARLETRPHILITPSDLRYFVKSVNNVLCINPGRLAKGLIGGTFSRVYIDLTKLGKSQMNVENCCKVEIVRI